MFRLHVDGLDLLVGVSYDAVSGQIEWRPGTSNINKPDEVTVHYFIVAPCDDGYMCTSAATLEI